MLIETIKNQPPRPVGGGMKTLKMASLPGHAVDIPDVRALVAECRLINSRWIYRYDIVVRLLSPFCLLSRSFIVSFLAICFETTSKSRTPSV